MNQRMLEERLADVPLGGIRYYPSVGSTNDVAAQWADKDADDFSLVIADTQTKGRGRSGKRWFSVPGAGLALSLVLKHQRALKEDQFFHVSRYTGLGALAVCQVLQDQYALPAKIKWPNDVLIQSRKCCGVLVEVRWQGIHLSDVILGIGVNISGSVPPEAVDLLIPATSVASELNAEVDRLDFLRHLLLEIQYWRSLLQEEIFRKTWESNLAFLGEQVQITRTDASGNRSNLIADGQIAGLQSDGSLVLRDSSGVDFVAHFGEITGLPRSSLGKRGFCIPPGNDLHLRSDGVSTKNKR